MLLKRLASNAMCPRCEDGAETLEHAFCCCPVAAEVWILIGLQWVISMNNLESFEWLTWVFNQGSMAQCRLFCCTLWSFWSDRNKRVHEPTIKTSRDISSLIESLKTFGNHRQLRRSRSTSMRCLTESISNLFQVW